MSGYDLTIILCQILTFSSAKMNNGVFQTYSKSKYITKSFVKLGIFFFNIIHTGMRD